MVKKNKNKHKPHNLNLTIKDLRYAIPIKNRIKISPKIIWVAVAMAKISCASNETPEKKK